MSIPPVPNHPPRHGRRNPAEETPESLTTQLFIGQDKPTPADGSTQALSTEEIERLRAMVASTDGAAATEVLSLDELRELAAARDEETGTIPAPARRASQEDIARAQAASAPKAWNPQSTPQAQPPAGPPQQGWQQPPTPPRRPYGSGPQNPGGYGGPPPPPHDDRNDTKKVPGWLWVLTSIALVAAIGIVGFIVWDSLRTPDTVASGPVTSAPVAPTQAPTPSAPDESPQPTATQTFSSPSNNITCTIDPERARCVINAYEYTPPAKPADCQSPQWGAIVVANKNGSGFSCVDAPVTGGPTQVLGYGQSVKADGMTCTSTKEGMTCTSDDTGVGFTVRRASVEFLK